MKYLTGCFIIFIFLATILLGCTPPAQEPAASPTQQITAAPLTQAPAPSPSPKPSPTDGMPLSLAGIVPGERIENIAEEYGLHYVTEDEADEAGLNDNHLCAYSYRYRTFYDGNGLVAHAFEDGTIGRVIVFAPGYETPDGHQVGEIWPYDQDIMIYSHQYGNLSYEIRYVQGKRIREIVMDVYFDRILSETKADLNDNGIDERFILTGRASATSFEVRPESVHHGINDENFIYDSDPATRPRLTVYENDDIIWTQELNYYYYYFPEPFPILTPISKNETHPVLELCYPTGGSGGDMYYKMLYDFDEDTYRIDFVGYGDEWELAD